MAAGKQREAAIVRGAEPAGRQELSGFQDTIAHFFHGLDAGIIRLENHWTLIDFNLVAHVIILQGCEYDCLPLRVSSIAEIEDQIFN